MAYIVPIHKASSVRHAVKLKLMDEADANLAVACGDHIEIYTPTQDGLIHRCTQNVYGKVTMLHRLQSEGSDLDNLFIGTDRYVFFTMSWDAAAKELRTEKSFIDLSVKSGRDSQQSDLCIVDPTEKVMIMHLYEGILTVLPLVERGKKRSDPSKRVIGEPIPVRVTEMFVRSVIFLQASGERADRQKPKIAVLYEDNNRNPHLSIKTLEYTPGTRSDSGTAEFTTDVEFDDRVEATASHLIPIHTPSRGFLVLSETSIEYVNEITGERLTKPLPQATIFCAWTAIDGNRWLLGDEYGALWLLMMVTDDEGRGGFEDLVLDRVGITARASALTYLDAGYLFVASHCGDSQLLRILDDAGGLEVIGTMQNLAPVLDFAVMDMGSREGGGERSTNEFSSGQARLVTGSGSFKDGSLRSVRSGVGLAEAGSLGGLGQVVDMFSVSSDGNTSMVDTLIASLVGETRVLKFSGEKEVEELSNFCGFTLSEETLLATTISSERLLQCCPSSVRITSPSENRTLSEWNAPEGSQIVAASCNGRHLALSIGGFELVVLDLDVGLSVASRQSFGGKTQISCLDAPALAPEICVVGFWDSADVSILRLSDLSEVSRGQISESLTVPRSLLLAQILENNSPTLLVATADGHVVTFDFDLSNYSLSSRLATVLGTEQVILRAVPAASPLQNVFAICENSSLIYGSDGRIVYSALTVEDALAVCQFDSQWFPESVAIAAADLLQISNVDSERRTHVVTLPVGETVRRIVYSSQLKAFAMGTIHRELKDDVEVVKSFVKLIDEVALKQLDSFSLNEDEIVECIMRADLDEGYGPVERIIVGTAYLQGFPVSGKADSGESERVGDELKLKGRIVILEVTPDRKFRQVMEQRMKAPCRSLTLFKGRIVAAFQDRLTIYNYDDQKLSIEARYRPGTTPIDVTVAGDRLVLADVMKSVSVISFRKGNAGEPSKLIEEARHYRNVWTTAVASLDDESFVVTDAEGNVMVLRRNIEGVTEDDRRRLEVTSEIRLGQMVNRIRLVNAPEHSEAVVVPRAFMATVDGGIFLFGLIHPSKQDLLMRLQSVLAERVPGPGGYPFNTYRAARTLVREAIPEEPFRFVDGELIELFIRAPRAVQEEVATKMKEDVEELMTLVLGLRGLR